MTDPRFCYTKNQVDPIKILQTPPPPPDPQTINNDRSLQPGKRKFKDVRAQNVPTNRCFKNLSWIKLKSTFAKKPKIMQGHRSRFRDKNHGSRFSLFWDEVSLQLSDIIIKGSLSSSWMNSPMPSLLLPLWQNESLSETIGIKIYVTCTVIRMKIKWFSWETFGTSTRSANIETQTVEVKVYICAKRPIRPALIKNNLTKNNLLSSRGLFTMSD